MAVKPGQRTGQPVRKPVKKTVAPSPRKAGPTYGITRKPKR
jgi:hypothetical protein